MIWAARPFITHKVGGASLVREGLALPTKLAGRLGGASLVREGLALPTKLGGRHWCARVLPFKTPTGFRPIAQGCAHRATLGNDRYNISTPKGLCTDKWRGLLKQTGNGMGRTRGVGFEAGLNQEDTTPLGLIIRWDSFPG